MARSLQYDWQVTTKEIKERGRYLLETGIWSDCRFVVGTEPNQQTIEGHKLILAMASPVFEAMFYGGMAESNPIAILDVQPDAFKALLEYIYTDKINFTSFDQACELCYGAKKYMLPHLVEECTKYLWSDLYPKNACRAYEFAKLFEEPILMEKCLDIICNKTREVLNESSFDDVELSTIVTIFEQDALDITSELDLFKALTKYASRQSITNEAKVPRLDNAANNAEESPSPSADAAQGYPTIRDALKKIRFLTLTPQMFAEGPAVSELLTQSEKFSILMNLSSPSTDVPMPEGFSTNTTARTKKVDVETYPYPPFEGIRVPLLGVDKPFGESTRKFYCSRQLLRVTECMNTSVLDCAVSFTCDKNICVYGIQVPTQIVRNNEEATGSYSELLYAHLLDGDGSRLTYTHFTSRVPYRNVIDICFNRPVYIQKNKEYKVGVVLNKSGCYPLGTYPSYTVCHGVEFCFGHGHSNLIRTIIFSISPVNQGLPASVGNSSIQNKFP